MHQHSEYGVAAHWRYKEGGARRGRARSAFDEKIAWLRQVLDWKDAVADAGEWLAGVQGEPVHRHDLRADAAGQGDRPAARRDAGRLRVRTCTPSLGHRCRGAKVDGQMVPLNHRSRNGQRSRSSRRSRAARRATGSTPSSATSRATARAPRSGSGSSASSTRRRSRRAARWSSASSRALGAHGAQPRRASRPRPGSRRPTSSSRRSRATRSTARRCRRRSMRVAQPARRAPRREPSRKSPTRKSRASGTGGGILVVGVDRLLTGLAKCCKPAPPDPIVGFVTRGKGVTIHRASCSNVARMRATQPERLIDAELGRAARRSVPGRHRGRGDATARACCATSPKCSRARRSTSPRRTRSPSNMHRAHGVHARGAEPRGAEARAGLRARREGRAERVEAVVRWRKGMGVEPTQERMAPLTGFEARPPHRGRIPSAALHHARSSMPSKLSPRTRCSSP